MTQERTIRKVLEGIARQRVALILQPGNVWVIDRAVKNTEENTAAFGTAYMRGWVEPLEHAIPQGSLTSDGKIPEGVIFDRIGPIYRLTETGWAVIHRTQAWGLYIALVTTAGLAFAAKSAGLF